jgi:hypothetical protein
VLFYIKRLGSFLKNSQLSIQPPPTNIKQTKGDSDFAFEATRLAISVIFYGSS